MSATELLALHEALLNEVWEPGGYRSFTIHEPKRRKISAAPFRDRIAHHALSRFMSVNSLLTRMPTVSAREPTGRLIVCNHDRYVLREGIITGTVPVISPQYGYTSSSSSSRDYLQ